MWSFGSNDLPGNAKINPATDERPVSKMSFRRYGVLFAGVV